MLEVEQKFELGGVLWFLSTGMHSVTYFKMDGMIHTIICTLDKTIIPVEQQRTEHKARHVGIPVWDCVNNNWKLIALENIIIFNY
jgi:WYL_2, Sm-like SH3 beta-barrel fold